RAPPSIPFFSTAPPSPALYTLSLHDALPISYGKCGSSPSRRTSYRSGGKRALRAAKAPSSACEPYPPTKSTSSFRLLATRRRSRSEEHTSELQSRENLVCRLLLEKKKNKTNT